MPTDDGVVSELNQVMFDALSQLQVLVSSDLSQRPNFLDIAKTFLLGVISTSVDLVEIHLPGSASLMYADIEAAAKLGGLSAISKWSDDHGSRHYSVSNIADDDIETGMNYMGKELATTLSKTLNELPMPLRRKEMPLRSIEVLLANLLHQKFDNDDPHKILDSFCEHVHMALTDLES